MTPFRIVTPAAMIGMMFMASTLVSPLYMLYQQAFGFSDVTLTLIYAVYVLGNLVALLFFGRLSDQIGRKPAAWWAIVVAVASTLLFLLAQGTAWLYVARALSGFAIGIASGSATAWLIELLGGEQARQASLITTTANFSGLGLGSLLAGFLAQYEPWPLQLSYLVYLAALVPLALLVRATPETVRQRRGLRQVSLRPRLGVPASVRRRFIAPAAAALGTFSFIGFYAALAPSLVRERLHIENHALGGAIVAELFIVSALAMIATRRLASASAMRWGLVLMLPSLVLLVLASARGSLLLLGADTAVVGLCAALAYRGSLQVANQLAPAAQRAEIASSYFVACFVGNSLPVIGIGWLSVALGSVAAISIFAAIIAAVAVGALVSLEYALPPRSAHVQGSSPQR
ncbi:MAG TPA: MFS transporter [Burkholderiales bacterium]|nr:MFS transporter [Burkholderiales bacterium]